ncbi:RNA polymerase sigma factor [Nocardiopsis dassonvillei]|uniref:RNA polymerase sigma factor n=1 Tax=Nocardiopsis dassonvillei TaxID=2014 RepID=UPI00366A89A3
MSNDQSSSAAPFASRTSDELIQEAAEAAITVAKHLATHPNVSSADAEDAAAQALEQFLQELDKGTQFRSVPAWVRHTAQRRHVDVVRRREHMNLTDSLEDTPVVDLDHRVSPEAALEFEDGTVRALELISLLPSAQRDVMKMIVIDRLKPTEIAIELGIATTTVHNRLHTARRTMLDKIGDEVIATSLGMDVGQIRARRRSSKTNIQEGGGP